MRILITGASGSIGKTLVPLLSGHVVYALGKTPIEGCENISCDLSEMLDFRDMPMGIDVIIHLAQSSKFRDFPESAMDVYNVNTRSTMILADYARENNVSKFIYASSGGIYGNRDTGFEEDDEIPVMNLGFYLGTKLGSEVILDSYIKFFDIDILRFFFVYGPDQDQHMLIPRLINNIKQGKPILLQGEAGIRINPIYVTDASRSIVECIGLKGSHKINIGGSQSLNLKELTETIGKQLGKQPVYEYDANTRPANVIGKIEKMSSLLSAPSVSIDEGIDLLLNNGENLN